jgi:hypothetical protein
MVPGRAHPADNDLLKRLVLENGALSAGMHFDPDWSPYSESTDDAGLHAAYYSPEEQYENHGVTIVGWDDAYPRERFQGDDGTPPGDGAFLVRNTWGDGFGEGGYFWVSYHDGSFALDRGTGTWGGCTSYSDVQEVSNYSRIYQYDRLGVNARWGYGIARVWGANRFTAATTEYIGAAGFYTLSSSTSYEVWAGRSFSTLSLRAKGTADLPGYRTVPFATRLRVYARRPFVVAVKLVSPNETYPMATERRIGGWAPLASAQRGQSFTSRNGYSWTDVTRVRAHTNVCIKAFAR